MSDNDSNNNMASGLLVGIVFVMTVIVIAKAVSQNKALIMNCMPIMGNELEGRMMKSNDTPTEEGFAPINPYFDSNDLKPKSKSSDPDWAKKYSTATDDLMNQNYVDNPDPRKYTMTKSSCGRRYMSRDLRKVPVPTRDPTTVTSFNLPFISPECVKYWQDSRPSLDC